MYIERLQHTEIPDASFLIANSFTSNEPLTRYLKVDCNSFQDWCFKIIDASIGDDMANYYPAELKLRKSLHIHLAATKNGHERKNVCFVLLSCLLRAAKDQDYEYAIAELTSSGTQHICLNKLNFQSLYNLDYKTDSRFPNLEGKCVLGFKKL